MAKFQRGSVKRDGFGIVILGELTPAQDQAIAALAKKADRRRPVDHVTCVTRRPDYNRIDFQVARERGVSPADVQIRFLNQLNAIR
ncbi:MAG TPA: hypothetical protein VF597_03815 [Candidatus Saccharimonadales bacterium]|jgi:hypothetical protein